MAILKNVVLFGALVFGLVAYGANRDNEKEYEIKDLHTLSKIEFKANSPEPDEKWDLWQQHINPPVITKQPDRHR